MRPLTPFEIDFSKNVKKIVSDINDFVCPTNKVVEGIKLFEYLIETLPTIIELNDELTSPLNRFLFTVSRKTHDFIWEIKNGFYSKVETNIVKKLESVLIMTTYILQNRFKNKICWDLDEEIEE